jgi:hypothetical protein
MKTKIKDIKGISCPPGKTHYLRHVTNKDTVTTQCNKAFMSNSWNYTDDEVNCPNCLLAITKREEVIRKPLKNTTQNILFCVSLLVIAVLTCCGMVCLFTLP